MRWISVYSFLQIVLSASALNSAAEDYRLAVDMNARMLETKFSLVAPTKTVVSNTLGPFVFALDHDQGPVRKPAGSENIRIYKTVHSLDLEHRIAGTNFAYSLFSAPILRKYSAPFGDSPYQLAGGPIKRIGIEITYYLPH